MEYEVKKTPLYGWHKEHRGKMVSFGQYMMPLWYGSGTKKEHIGVLEKAGAFDTCHMAVVLVEGPGSFDLLQSCFTRDLNACVDNNYRPIKDGRCVYGAFLNERGECLDDAIVYQITKEAYMVVVNSGMGGKIAAHMEKSHSEKLKVKISDLTDKMGKMDIQGPLSAKILSKVLQEPLNVFENLIYFSFKGHFDRISPFADQVRLTDGTPLLLSRSGYTGELGFEIFIDPEHIVKIWKMIMEAGKESGIIPCGLASRDSLRTGALLPLSHQDINGWPYVNHPWDFALPIKKDRTGFTKRFIGDEALKSVKNPAYTLPFLGRDLRKINTHDAVVFNGGGDEIGVVLTCTTDMAMGYESDRIYSIASPDKPEGFNPRGLSCGFIKVKSKLDVGHAVELRDKKRRIEATIVQDIRPDRTGRRPLYEFLN